MEELLLIEQVRAHEVIFNVKSPEYRDQHVRQAAWEEIAKKLKIPANEAKERWNKLRRCFCNARNRRRGETKSGIVYKKKNSWKYEQQMEFLTPFIETRITHSNLDESEVSVLSSEPEDILAAGCDTEECALIHTEEQTNFDVKNEQSDNNNRAAEGVASISTGNDGTCYQEAVKAIKNNQRQTSIDAPVNKMVQILQENSDRRKRKYKEKTTPSTQNSPETMDDMDMFFLSMSRMTKKLPKVDQAQIKLSLSNAVLSAEIRDQQLLCPPSCSHHSFHQVQRQHYSSTPSPEATDTQSITSRSDCCSPPY